MGQAEIAALDTDWIKTTLATCEKEIEELYPIADDLREGLQSDMTDNAFAIEEYTEDIEAIITKYKEVTENSDVTMLERHLTITEMVNELINTVEYLGDSVRNNKNATVKYTELATKCYDKTSALSTSLTELRMDVRNLDREIERYEPE